MSQVKTTIGGSIVTVEAAANTSKNRFIVPSGAICGANIKALGVSRDAANAGQSLPVQIDGIVWVEAGAAVSVGALVKSNASGCAIAVAAGTDIVNGLALDEATLAQQIIRIKVL